MTRTTLGNRMAAWEKMKDDRDERMWNDSLELALQKRDYSKVKSLLESGLLYEYEFPVINDPIAKEILNQLINP